MEDTWKDLRKEVGKNVEDSGRLLRRKQPLTLDELTAIQNTLTISAKNIRVIKSATKKV